MLLRHHPVDPAGVVRREPGRAVRALDALVAAAGGHPAHHQPGERAGRVALCRAHRGGAPFGAVGRMVRFDVTPVIRSCITLERPLARKHGADLQWETSVDSLYLYGDSGALYQVLTNLIRNAVDASHGRKGAVVVSVNRRGDNLNLLVQDAGQGIAPEHLSRIFDHGFTTKPPGKGSGIGLAVVKEITESMFGGTIAVESRVGTGTTFTLALPIPPQRNR